MGSLWAEPVTATVGPLDVTSVHTSCPLFPSHMSYFITNPCTGACPWGAPIPHSGFLPHIFGHPPAHAVGTSRGSWGAQEPAQLPSYFIKLELYFGALFNSGVCTVYASMLRGPSWAYHRSPTTQTPKRASQTSFSEHWQNAR